MITRPTGGPILVPPPYRDEWLVVAAVNTLVARALRRKEPESTRSTMVNAAIGEDGVDKRRIPQVVDI